MRVLLVALIASVVFAVVAFAASPSRVEPTPSRGGHALTVQHATHGIGRAVISYQPVVTG